MSEKRNENIVERALVDAVVETFGDMAFLDVIEVDENTDFETSQLLCIDFSAPLRGTIVVAMPLEAKRNAVENIHAKGWEELSVTEVDDCLLEMLNVLTGNFLQNLYGRQVKVNLSFPHIIFDLAEAGVEDKFEEFNFDAEGVSFRVSIWVENEGGKK